MNLIHAAAIVGAGLIIAAGPATAGPGGLAGSQWVKPNPDVVQIQYRDDDAIPEAIIGGVIGGLVGGALGGGCYYNDCGDGDGYYGGGGYYGGYGGYGRGGWRGGGWHGGGGRVGGGGHMAGGGHMGGVGHGGGRR